MSKIPFGKIARSLTGFSTPVFGVSWTVPPTDRAVVQRLITYLEDRRALYYPFDAETPDWVSDSVLQIRETLTRILQKLNTKAEAVQHVRAMRAASRKFLDETGRAPLHRTMRGFQLFGEEARYFTSLGELRAVFGIHLAHLCAKYGIDVEEGLASIIPSPEDTEGEPAKRRRNRQQ